MNIVIQYITQRLKEHIDKFVAHQYAWWILQALTQKNTTELIAQNKVVLTKKQQATLEQWLDSIVHDNKPLQYLIGSIPFIELEILVEPPLLIPRPETEEWCSELINQLKPFKNEHLTILDLCTGTGCIALALVRTLPKAQIIATDINQSALELAQKNAQHNNINNVRFIQSDLFDAIPTLRFDLITTNPPYISYKEWKTVEPSVKKWEDKKALIAADNGLVLIKKIINQAPYFFKKQSIIAANNFHQLLIEIGHAQGNAVYNVMKQAQYTQIKIQKDFAGNDRLVLGKVEHVATEIT